jgi:hypothetical protein
MLFGIAFSLDRRAANIVGISAGCRPGFPFSPSFEARKSSHLKMTVSFQCFASSDPDWGGVPVIVGAAKPFALPFDPLQYTRK